ncbi:tyrosine-type recombinase/integrase [Lachnospiraceae bacterium LCP19S3_B12]
MLRSILHCDMNNFYASVECMLDPALKKYPIAVCGSVEERHGIVLAKNYKAIRRIIRDCNDEQLLKDENAEVLLPHFSCHSLRHTFTTRMCEAGVNVKVIQDTLGHIAIRKSG